MIACANPPVPFDHRTLCTLQAAVAFWDERNLPEDRKRSMEDFTHIAQCGGRFPELDAEELHKLLSSLAALACTARQEQAP